MTDERVERYARLLVETCVGVQPGWEVLVLGSPQGRPLLEELGRALARCGAYAVYQLSFTGTIPAADRTWVQEAPTELLGRPAALQVHLLEKCDAIVAVFPVGHNDQIMLVTDGGMVIRCPVDDIRIARRRSQGVVVFKVGDGERVVSVARLPEDSEANGEANGSDDSAEDRQINEGET